MGRSLSPPIPVTLELVWLALQIYVIMKIGYIQQITSKSHVEWSRTTGRCFRLFVLKVAKGSYA